MSDDRLTTALELCIQRKRVCPMRVDLLGNANDSAEYLFDWRQSGRLVCFACRTGFRLTFFPVEKRERLCLKEYTHLLFQTKKKQKVRGWRPSEKWAKKKLTGGRKC